MYQNQHSKDEEDFTLDPFHDNNDYSQSRQADSEPSINIDYQAAELLRCTSLMEPASTRMNNDHLINQYRQQTGVPLNPNCPRIRQVQALMESPAMEMPLTISCLDQDMDLGVIPNDILSPDFNFE
jgi:hypothetical protein